MKGKFQLCKDSCVRATGAGDVRLLLLRHAEGVLKVHFFPVAADGGLKPGKLFCECHKWYPPLDFIRPGNGLRSAVCILWTAMRKMPNIL